MEWPYLKEECGLEASQIKKFDDLWSFYEEEIKIHNFTAIRDKDGFEAKHFADSIIPVIGNDDLKKGRLLDIGTGGGFPGIPLAILFPNLKVYLLDSNKKHTEMLERLIKKFDLKNVEVVRARAEELGHDATFRETFDFVTTRAFAKWSSLLEMCVPFLKVGGQLLAYKGPEDYAQIKEMNEQLELLGAGDPDTQKYKLPNQYGGRVLVTIDKKNLTPERYPRSAVAIKKRPLFESKKND